MTKQTSSLRSNVAILSLFAMAQCLGAVDPALSPLAAAYNIPASTAMYCSTVASLVSVVTCLAMGVLAGKKLGYRAAVRICGALMIFGGVMPCFVRDFWLLLLFRGVFGAGMGGLMSIQNPLATRLSSVEKRAKLLGAGAFCAFASNAVLQFVAGALTDVGWNYAFLTHLILLLPFGATALLLPKLPLDQPAPKATGKGGRVRLAPAATAVCVIFGLSSMLMAPVLIGSSFLSGAIVASGKVAGVVIVFFSVGCMLGGLVYPILYKLLGRRCLALFFLIGAVGLFGCAAVRTIPLLCGCILVCGVSSATMMAATMMVIGLVSSPESVGLASALMTALQNLFTFLCSSWQNLVEAVTGDALYMPIYLAAAVYLLIAVGMLVKSPFPKAAPMQPIS